MRYLILLLTATLTLSAQEFTKAIEDNSYFIEEAYNQEDRVVQHIFNGAAMRPGTLTEMSFTQEWPAFGRGHQLSITLPYLSQSTPSANGFGDVMLNYRYQAVDEPGFAVSPRLSFILPTGDDANGFGTGKAGVQFNLPVSKRWSNDLITHGNAGATIVPDGVTVGAGKETYSDYFIGASAIYLATPTFNVMCEVLHTNGGSAAARTGETIVSPGLRYAHNIGDLQIVPGIAFPFSFSSGGNTNGVFLYLSFEHPY
jgi:hypothetical protein